MSEIWGHLGARLVVSGEVRNQQAKREWGDWESLARACRLFGCLEGVAAQPLRYCRLTAHYLHHHQNAATPNKEGKNKQNRKNKQHVRVRGILLDFHDYCFQIQVSFYVIQSWVISTAYFLKMPTVICQVILSIYFFSFALQRKPQDRGAQAWSEVVFLLLAVTNPLPYFWTLSEMWPQLAGRRGEDWGWP